ncbi:DUF6998 domain-containing protein [Methylomonas sp. 11b]|uniref:DUF6998 domain-containing protein n=1 Tax=Methylomonas sp. 11b TaxID=1168169 RepID=UPI000478CC03|nr:hypothetical protein [Methylomonas sp. 11b]
MPQKPITIPDAVRQLLAIVELLRQSYKTQKKQFTLDGRLVGDLGEVLAEEAYDIKLFEDLQKHHDATASDGRLVQIKATMQKNLTFPVDHIPLYYIGIQIHSDGTFSEVFNGPGALAWEAVKNRKPTKTNLHSVSVSALSKLNAKVAPADRIPKRALTLRSSGTPAGKPAAAP